MPISLPAPCTDYADVIARLGALDGSLSDPDGLRWFSAASTTRPSWSCACSIAAWV